MRFASYLEEKHGNQWKYREVAKLLGVRVNAKSDGRRRGDAGVSSSSGGEKEERV